MNPTGQLKDEHDGIKWMLKILGEVCRRMEAGQEADVRHILRIIEFLKVFVDKCHHAKEEDLLFPAMEKAGVPREEGPIGVLLAEHQKGRSLIQGMSEAAGRYQRGDKEASRPFVENARGYIDLLLGHIDKEDNVLYPMADARLSEKTQRELAEGFDRVEEERVGRGKHEEFHALMDRLKKIYLP